MQFEEGKVHKTIRTNSGAECTLRWARKDDLEQLLNFINEMAEEDTYIPYSPDDKETPESEEKWLSWTLNACSKGDESYIVAEVGGKIVGAAEIKRDLVGKSRTRHIATFGITILSEARGMGIGHALIQLCIDHATSFLEDIKMITLNAFSDNDRALALYEKYGFQEVGRVPNAYFRKNQYSDQVIMAKELSE